MNKVIKRTIAIFILFFTALSLSCSDSTTAPNTGSISGTVTFVGNWPSTGEVQVSVYQLLDAPFIPTGPPEQATDALATTTSYDFKFEGLDKTSYAAIFVGWRDPANPAGARLLGVYWANSDSVGISSQTGLPVQQPSSVTIDDNNVDVSGINITANLNLAPQP